MPRTLTTGQLAQQAGIAASAVRYYEEVGLLPAPPRVSGQRRYGPDALDRVAVIKLAKRAGFRIDEIATLMNGFSDRVPPSERWRTLAGRKLQEVDRQIARARKMKRLLLHGLKCDCLRLKDCALAKEI